MRPRFIAICVAIIAAVGIAFADRTQAVTIDTVPVGNIGNANDPATGGLYGGVSYAYRVGTTEVTVGQYTAFLNAVAKTDTYALYNPSMATNLSIAGILKSGVSPNYGYDVIGSPNKPVTYVSWGDAARFANWLHNGQPMGLQDATTTEDGAYALDGAVGTKALIAVTRNAGARWFIPTENEWYKAAYYQPAGQGGDVDDYWAYATRTNNVPYSDQPPGTDAPTQTNTANFLKDDDVVNGYDDGYAVTGSPIVNNNLTYSTDAGAYNLSVSPYGTFDQGGNVREWTETASDDSYRRLRDGAWGYSSSLMQASFRGFASPLDNGLLLGFRVASIPEPNTLLLAAFSLFSLLGIRRR